MSYEGPIGLTADTHKHTSAGGPRRQTIEKEEPSDS